MLEAPFISRVMFAPRFRGTVVGSAASRAQSDTVRRTRSGTTATGVPQSPVSFRGPASDCRRKPLSQARPCPRQSALHGPEGDSKRSSRLRVGHPLEVAEYDARPSTRGKPINLGVHPFGRLPALHISMRARLCGSAESGTRCGLGLQPVSSGPSPAGGQADAHRDLVKPGTQGFPDPEPPCIPDQKQERGLEGVLGVVVIAEYRPANAHDHGAVPTDERGEGGLGDLRILLRDRRSLQEVRVAQVSETASLGQSQQRGSHEIRAIDVQACSFPGRTGPASRSCLGASVLFPLVRLFSLPEAPRHGTRLSCPKIPGSQSTSTWSRHARGSPETQSGKSRF